jgi:hypothetical protein
MSYALKKVLKADIIAVNNWLKKSGPSIYSGFTFAVNGSTKKQSNRYTKSRECQKAGLDFGFSTRICLVFIMY